MVNVKFISSEWATFFVQEMNNLPCDVNLYDGIQVFDAKSILAILSLDFSKTFKVECITPDNVVYQKFTEVIKEFEA